MNEQLFWSKVNKQSDGCWIWTGAKTYDDYGVMAVKIAHRKYKMVCVHRWVWEQEIGPIPEGLHLDHLCKVRLCVNPEHLEPVTPAENVRRSKQVSQRHGLCLHGHDLTIEGSIYIDPKGYKRCRMCRLDSVNRHRAHYGQGA